MATDWSDPEQVERELRRRERGEAPAGDSPSDMRLLLGAMHSVLEAHKRTDTQTASLAEDIATLRGLLDRLERARSARQPEAESGLATRLAEAEGRIAGHVDSLVESIRPVRDAWPDIETLARTAASTPERLERLSAGVQRSGEAAHAQNEAIRANTDRLTKLVAHLDKKLPALERSMTDRFAEEAKGVRGTLQETAAVVRTRRRRTRRFWLGLVGAVLLGLLVCVGAGVWVQSEYGLLPAHDPTRGWRDGIWNDYGPVIKDCILEARKTKRHVDCRLSPSPGP